jgi:hypothetical protein
MTDMALLILGPVNASHTCMHHVLRCTLERMLSRLQHIHDAYMYVLHSSTNMLSSEQHAHITYVRIASCTRNCELTPPGLIVLCWIRPMLQQ